MKTRLMPLVALAALLLAGAQAASAAETFTDRVERTFNTGPGVVVKLGNTNGSVYVEAWDGDAVELLAEKRVQAGSRGDAEEAFEDIEIVIRESNGSLDIETKLPSASEGFFDWIFGRARNSQVRYELRVPRTAELELRTVNGNVTTNGIGGYQLLGSTNGRIEVDDARDGIEGRTTNGAIRVEVSDGAATPDIELRSTNGGISLALPASLAGRLTARTVNGSVKSDLPVTIDGSASRRRLKGELNGGGASRIEVSTTNGGIRIRESD